MSKPTLMKVSGSNLKNTGQKPRPIRNICLISRNVLWSVALLKWGTTIRVPNRKSLADENVEADEATGEMEKSLMNVIAPFMALGAGQGDRQGHPLSVTDQVVLGAILAPVSGRGSGFFPRARARTEVESTTALDQSISPASRRWSSRWRWMACHTPWSCQSRN